ncbi:MAG TPA: diguanylate cyclase, partial [Firmicutes bacterium]|nr:diguanylate cyclase [Bacillota bacterium]
ARAVGERLRAAVKSAPFPQRKFTISIGVAAFPEDADSASGLIRAADDALRKAKREGKDAVIMASQSQNMQRETFGWRPEFPKTLIRDEA